MQHDVSPRALRVWCFWITASEPGEKHAADKGKEQPIPVVGRDDPRVVPIEKLVHDFIPLMA
jgi:hypothetical protein